MDLLHQELKLEEEQKELHKTSDYVQSVKPVCWDI
jgi:hypothetical protein